MNRAPTTRNAQQWQQIALFLEEQPARKTLTLKQSTTAPDAQAKRAAGAVVRRADRRFLKVAA